ncbi:MAG TPA: zinc ribbon domain-containing protein [Acidobacteriota bacterium]|nr:zinc ribbon domain-containing protein [Acidobacteriota bacterium]
MPIYEYRCLQCDHTFQEMISFSVWEKKQKDGFTCPKCGSRNVEQALSANVQTSKKS